MTTVTDFAPFIGTLGGGLVGGMLAGYAIKKVIRFAAVILGLFITGLAYLEYQKLINVDWVKVQSFSNGIMWIVDSLTHISNNVGEPHTADFGISNIVPLTSRVSAGFMLGILRG